MQICCEVCTWTDNHPLISLTSLRCIHYLILLDSIFNFSENRVLRSIFIDILLLKVIYSRTRFAAALNILWNFFKLRNHLQIVHKISSFIFIIYCSFYCLFIVYINSLKSIFTNIYSFSQKKLHSQQQ